MSNTHKEHHCPNCGNKSLEYGDNGLNDNQYYYEWECTSCGTTGTEYLNLVFSGHNNIEVPKPKTTKAYLCNPFTLADACDYLIVHISPERAAEILALHEKLKPGFDAGVSEVRATLATRHSTDELLLVGDTDELQNAIQDELDTQCNNEDITGYVPKLDRFKMYPPIVEITPDTFRFYVNVEQSYAPDYELRTNDFLIEDLKSIA